MAILMADDKDILTVNGTTGPHARKGRVCWLSPFQCATIPLIDTLASPKKGTEKQGCVHIEREGATQGWGGEQKVESKEYVDGCIEPPPVCHDTPWIIGEAQRAHGRNRAHIGKPCDAGTEEGKEVAS